VYVTYYMMNGTTSSPELLENLKLELRRGCLIVAVLAQLRTEQYGYTLRKALAEAPVALTPKPEEPTAPPEPKTKNPAKSRTR